MKILSGNVYQFRIELQEIAPPVWRRIQVPETFTYWDLHVAIQDSMGWTDTHLHEFVVKNPKTGRIVKIGLPDEDFGAKVAEGWKKKINGFFSLHNPQAEYIYDFGDNWRHVVTLEAILPRQAGVHYPLCVGGERSCPPEDCGGSCGYEDFLEIIMDPEHEDRDSMLAWVGRDFRPKHFECSEVIFDDPTERLKRLFEDY